MFDNHYPYTDFHELNADWLLKNVVPLPAELNNLKSAVNTELNDLKSDVNTELDGKVDKIAGKGLSANDFTDADKTKLDGIETGAQVNVQADWDENDPDSDAYIQNKPTITPGSPKNIWYAECSTSAGTAAKTAATNTQDFVLAAGNMVRVKFTNANSYNGTSTLNIDGTGAVSIARIGTTTTTRYYWTAGEVIDLVYDGTNFVMSNKGTAGTTYYGLTKLSSSVSSTSEALAATPKAVKTVNDALAGKVDAVVGMGLSENSFTTAEQSKLAGIEAGAQVNVAEIAVTDVQMTLQAGVDNFSVQLPAGQTLINMYLVESWVDTSSIVIGFFNSGNYYTALLKSAPTANRATTVRTIKYLGG